MRGHGVAPGSGKGAKVSWSEAPLEQPSSLSERLARSGGKETHENQARASSTLAAQAMGEPAHTRQATQASNPVGPERESGNQASKWQ